MYDFIGAAVLIFCLLSWWAVAFIGGAIREARDNGWHPDRGPLVPTDLTAFHEARQNLHIRRAGTVGWVEDTEGNVVWPESPVAEAESLLRGESA